MTKKTAPGNDRSITKGSTLRYIQKSFISSRNGLDLIGRYTAVYNNKYNSDIKALEKLISENDNTLLKKQSELDSLGIFKFSDKKRLQSEISAIAMNIAAEKNELSKTRKDFADAMNKIGNHLDSFRVNAKKQIDKKYQLPPKPDIIKNAEISDKIITLLSGRKKKISDQMNYSQFSKGEQPDVIAVLHELADQGFVNEIEVPASCIRIKHKEYILN